MKQESEREFWSVWLSLLQSKNLPTPTSKLIEIQLVSNSKKNVPKNILMKSYTHKYHTSYAICLAKYVTRMRFHELWEVHCEKVHKSAWERAKSRLLLIRGREREKRTKKRRRTRKYIIEKLTLSQMKIRVGNRQRQTETALPPRNFPN